MKKSLILLCILALLSLGGIFAAHVALTQTQESAVLTEHPVAGDPAAAEGLTLHSRSEEQFQLYWDMAVTPGGETSADFRYFSQAFSQNFPADGMTMDSFFPEMQGSTRYYYPNDPILSAVESQPWLEQLQKAFPSITTRHDPDSAVIDLSDYMDVYPLSFYIEFGDHRPEFDTSGTDVPFWDELRQAFRFPVVPGHRMAVAFEEGSSPELDRFIFSPIQEVTFDELSVNSSDGLWFIPIARKDNGELLDYSLTPGYGVYYLPYPHDGLKPGQLRLVCPLSEEEDVVQMVSSRDGTILYVVTTSPDGARVHVIPETEPKRQQVFPLQTSGEYAGILMAEDNHFLHICDRDLWCYAREEDGQFALRFQGRLPEDDRFSAYYADDINRYTSCFDGQRLALAIRPDPGSLPGGRRVSNGAAVSIFSADGTLDYAAVYTNSLDDDDSFLAGVAPSSTLGPSLGWEVVP